MASYKEKVTNMKRRLSSEIEKRKKLKRSELFVLDNSLRETTVGQLRGHTLENKWKIYEEVGVLKNVLACGRFVSNGRIEEGLNFPEFNKRKRMHSTSKIKCL